MICELTQHVAMRNLQCLFTMVELREATWIKLAVSQILKSQDLCMEIGRA